MARKERAGKTVYLYEPLYNKLTPTTYKEIAGWLGAEPSTVKSYGAKGLYHHKLDAYILNEKPGVAKRRRINEKFNAKGEIWKISSIHGLKVSNYGRFIGTDSYGNEHFILPHMVNSSTYIVFKNKTRNARNIVYTTFVGKIKEGNQVFIKNEPKNNIGADNLMQMTINEYTTLLNRTNKCKAVVYLNEKGELIDEFKSTVQAAEYTLYDRMAISRVCRGEIKVPYSIGYANAFMWADEYYEKEGIC